LIQGVLSDELMSNIPTYERLLISVAVLLAFATACTGFCLAYRTGDFHWMNRAGAGVVALQAIAIVVEFLRRDRLQALFRQKLIAIVRGPDEIDYEQSPELKALTFLEREIKKAESRVLIVAVLLAMVGELLHGFGDLLMEVLIS
jgi:hypothetical protein